MKTRFGTTNPFRLGVMAIIFIGIASCAAETTTPTGESPVSTISPLSSPVGPSPTPEIPLSAGEKILDSWTGDLDADGQPDLVAAVGNDDQVVRRLRIYDIPDGSHYAQTQEMELPEAGIFHQMVVVDLDIDGAYDIGVYEAMPQTDEFALFVYMQRGNSFTLSSPQGGVLDGELGFTSLAEPSLIGDLDAEGGLEVVVFVEGASEDYLASRAYSWDGDSYSFADYLYLPGRKRP